MPQCRLNVSLGRQCKCARPPLYAYILGCPTEGMILEKVRNSTTAVFLSMMCWNRTIYPKFHLSVMTGRGGSRFHFFAKTRILQSAREIYTISRWARGHQNPPRSMLQFRVFIDIYVFSILSQSQNMFHFCSVMIFDDFRGILS